MILALVYTIAMAGAVCHCTPRIFGQGDGLSKSKTYVLRDFSDVAREVLRFGRFKLPAGKLRWIWSRFFLRSDEWKALRYRAIKRFGGKCMACGRLGTDYVLNVDHIRPRRRHPELALELSNLQVLCADCNRGKGNRDMTDWRR